MDCREEHDAVDSGHGHAHDGGHGACHDEHAGHGHGHGGAAGGHGHSHDDPERGFEQNLLPYIDSGKVTCDNEAEDVYFGFSRHPKCSQHPFSDLMYLVPASLTST